jgi:hypothetical protein
MRKSVSGLYREIEEAQFHFYFDLQWHRCTVLRSSDEGPNDGEYFFSWAYLTCLMLSRWARMQRSIRALSACPRSFGQFIPPRSGQSPALFLRITDLFSLPGTIGHIQV